MKLSHNYLQVTLLIKSLSLGLINIYNNAIQEGRFKVSENSKDLREPVDSFRFTHGVHAGLSLPCLHILMCNHCIL